MKIGMIGIGKLGMPVALAFDYKGHDVMCYDADHRKMQKETFLFTSSGDIWI